MVVETLEAKGADQIPSGQRVLVCGAGFAGLATAFWMERLGYRVTVVETAAGLRKGGTPVDLEGDTIAILRRMGLLDAARARSLPPRRTEFKNSDNVTQALLPAQPVIVDGPGERYEIDRDELLELLFAAVEPKSHVGFGRSAIRLDAKQEAVEAWFDDGSRETFAFVFGCDGMRSNTRRLIFGSSDAGLHDLRLYTFLKVVPRELIERNSTEIYSVPGRTVMLNGYEGKTDIAFAFHADGDIAYDRHDRAQLRRLVRERFVDVGWRVPDLLDEVDAEGAFYFDRICQVRLPAWSQGRIALVGDAGYCPSPLAGMGGSMALMGAAALADAFGRHPDDHAAALTTYEAGLRPFVEKVQDEALSVGLPMFAPATEAALVERDRMLAGMTLGGSWERL